MARGTFGALLRVRRLAVNEAMRDLAAAMRDAEQAGRDLAALTEAVTRERDLARDPEAADLVSAGFAAWHERLGPEIASATARRDGAEQGVAAARVMLGARRGAARAVEAAMERRRSVEQATTTRRAQHELEDIARCGAGAARDGTA